MNQLQTLFPILILVVAFWFLIMRPQQQRAKQQKSMLSALKPGDEIVTIGGIFGTVVETGERIRIRVADGSELEVAVQAIGSVVPPKDEASADDTDMDEAEDDVTSVDDSDRPADTTDAPESEGVSGQDA